MKRLTRRHRKLVRALVMGKTMAVAAKEAGFPGTPESARVQASRLLRNRYFQEAIDKEMERGGLGLNMIWRKLANFLEAKTVILATHRGRVTDSREVDDNQTQFRALELVFRLRGLLRPSADAEVKYAPLAELIETVRKSAEERGVKEPCG